MKRQYKFIIIFIGFCLCCQTAFSNSMNTNPQALSIDFRTTAIATVTIVNSQGTPLNNSTVSAVSSDEGIVTVAPGTGMTNAEGMVVFTITGVLHGSAKVAFSTDTLSNSMTVTVVSNIAPCATASSSGGGLGNFSAKKMNDGREKDDCSYHWIKTRNEIGQKRNAWIRLDWNEIVTITKMSIQTPDCEGTCGDSSDEPLYIDPGRNLGNGTVQYLGGDGIAWITEGTLVNKTGDFEYSFTKPIQSKAIRIRKISPALKCKGQQSNPVVFEWKVYGTSPCR